MAGFFALAKIGRTRLLRMDSIVGQKDDASTKCLSMAVEAVKASCVFHASAPEEKLAKAITTLDTHSDCSNGSRAFSREITDTASVDRCRLSS